MEQTKHSLYTHLMIIVVPSVMIVTSINSFFHYQSTKNRIIEETKHHSTKSINSLNKNVSNFIESYSVNEYGNLVSNEMDFEGFKAIIIHDYNMGKILDQDFYVSGKIRGADGNVIDYEPEDKAMNKRLNECFLTFTSRMMSGSGIELGEITICSSGDAVKQELRKSIKESLLYTIFISIGLILVLFLTIHRYILKPVSEIAKILSKTDDRGIPTGSFSAQGAQEIVTLSTSFGNMIDSIKESRQNLEEHHVVLEQRVKERTINLSKTNENLQIEVVERLQAEKKLHKSTQDLGERVKQLKCLYGISKLVEKENITLEEILQGTVDIIPLSLQYPEVTCAQIKLDGHTYKTDNFSETEWIHSQQIVASGEKTGEVKVYYLEGKSKTEEGLFLEEEKKLINVVAERLGHISERFQASETLKESEKQLQIQKKLIDRSQEIAHIGSWHLDLKKNNLTWSDENYRVFGRTKGKFEGTYEAFLDTVHPDDREMVDTTYKSAIISNLPYECFHRIIRDDGEVRIVHEKSEDIIDENGETIHSFGFTHDITEHKQAEEENKKLQTQLRQSHKMEAIGTMAGGIAHDFNNILAAVLGYADMAKDDTPDSSPAKYQIEQVIKAGNRAKELVRHILTFSRMSIHATDHIPIDISSTIKEVLKFQRSIIPTTISIKSDIDENCGLIKGDPTQIHQVVMNLCSNASHAIEDQSGSLEVSVHKIELSSDDLEEETHLSPGSYIKLSVQDTGTGLTQELINKIFDPYFTTKEVGSGSGMGLSVVLGIAKIHGGFVKVDSELGKGSIFSVFFPRINKEILEEDNKKVEVLPTGTERILFVDDESMLVDIGKSTLERLGYSVTTKTDSTEALGLFKSDPSQFDLVITDQTMPNMPGSILAYQLLQVRPDIPIIMCTGHSDIINEIKSQKIGIKEYTLKPVSKKDIAKLIRKVLDTA